MNEAEAKAAFEEASAEMLQTAYDYVDHAEELEKIWVYAYMEDGWVTAAPAYQVGGKVYESHEVAKALPGKVDADSESPVNPITDTAFAYNLQFEDPKEAPTRVVITYDVPKQAMDAEFNYDPIIRESDEDDPGTVMRKWMDNLKTSGVARA